jgi:hypothetical protein
MKSQFCLFALLVIATASVIPAQQPESGPKNRPLVFSANFPTPFATEMKPHLAEARKTYPEAKRRFAAGLPAQYRFLVTTGLKLPDGKFEQVFILVLTVDEEKQSITGRIAHPRNIVETYKLDQIVTLPEVEVIDWTISHPDGTEEGNYIGKFLDAHRKQEYQDGAANRSQPGGAETKRTPAAGGSGG